MKMFTHTLYPEATDDKLAANTYHNLAESSARETVEGMEDFYRSTMQQMDALSLQFTLHYGDKDYPSSNDMFEDVSNGHIFVRSTLADIATLPSQYPGLRNSQIRDSQGELMTVNDVFRCVHDVYGHWLSSRSEHYSFSMNGEMHAWIRHRDYYPKSALNALWCETRGQSAWWGAYDNHADIPPSQRPFPAQKYGSVPRNMI